MSSDEFISDQLDFFLMSENEVRRESNNAIYKDFCNGMRNQSREQVRIAGDIACRMTKGSPSSRSSDALYSAATSFCQIEGHLENIENNLNKVCALTRQPR